MQNSYKQKFKKAILANIAMVIILLALVPFSMVALINANHPLSGLYFLLGGSIAWWISYFLACYFLAKSKGYSGWFVLSGLLIGYVGLIVLLLLPSKVSRR